ncbi:MAG: hypothetical protein WB493_06170 [Anaeromyxobacteraceae bacterium]
MPPPPEPVRHDEATSTGGWPTGILDVAGGPSAEVPGTGARALASDPFAAFGAAEPAPAPSPTPPGPMAAVPGDLAPAGGFLGSLPVTDLSDLERTGAVPLVPSLPPVTDLGSQEGLALEERAPAPAVREAAARWDDPEVSHSVAMGPDGFQEVDLRGAAPADPDFDPHGDGPTRETALPPPPPAPAAPPVAEEADATSRAPPPSAPGNSSPLVPGEPTGSRRIEPARARALAMNVLSLAALLVVTLGLVAWWRGEGLGGLVPWGYGSRQGVDVSGISSGVYEGVHGHPVVFVRGTLRSARDPLAGPIPVRVVLERGGSTLGVAIALAGAVPTVEELAAVASDDDLQRLRDGIASRAPRRIEPGAEVPFLAVLPLPTGDVGGVRFRVEPLPQGK